MTSGQPARTAARRSRSTVYGRRRRRRRRRGALVGAAIVPLLAHAAFAGSSRSHSPAARQVLNGHGRADVPAVRWPQQETQDQSAVAVQAGEQLTERQLLEALLIPSGNNIARMLAPGVAGSETRFIAETNAEGYAGKTGSDSAAEGCLAFLTHVTIGGHRLTAVGVVMGQGQGSDTSMILAAAGDGATQLLDSAAPATRVRTRRDPPLLSAPGPAAAQN